MSTGVDAMALRANCAALERELGWLERVLRARFSVRFHPDAPVVDARGLAPPDLSGDRSQLAGLVAEYRLGWAERLVLILAAAPHLRPQCLDPLFLQDAEIGRGFTEFGGWKGRAHGGFLPTGETAAMLVADGDLAERIALRRLFEEHHPFHRQRLLRLEYDAPGEPFLSGALVLSEEALQRLTTGGPQRPETGLGFPARLITTELTWDDLVLAPETRREIDVVRGWIDHGHTILGDWGLGRILKPGYRSLFFGPPGTGKTLTAMVIGQEAGKPVYRIDLSMVVSKYIGETEKNLARVFDQAQWRDWILFFDEADALFGKRTATASSNDRYANQEVSYLLQRVEDFPGNVILASNLKANIDEAFARRFQSMVYFPMPDADHRLRLWQGILRDPGRLAADIGLRELADRYEISGGAIANVVRFAAINALSAGRATIRASDLTEGVAKELRKEGRSA
jgi:AAA+ superfamily predicted ATPase